jgi:AcrR family transcriptional regulator
MTRADEIVAAARTVLERDGPGGLTMQAVAAEVGIKAPSLYKHVGGKATIEIALVAAALREMGDALHAAARRDGRQVTDLLAAYRRHALAHPELYRLATEGRLPRDELPAGLEAWAGDPFLLVTGDPYRAQALWSLAHGMVVLELDGRYPPGSDLDRTWAAAAAAFTPAPQVSGTV